GAGSPVDLVGVLAGALLAIRIAVVAERAATPPDGFAEDGPDRPCEVGDFGGPQACRDPLGSHTGQVEGLVGVDIADAGEQGLVEQGCLDRPPGGGKRTGELASGDGE